MMRVSVIGGVGRCYQQPGGVGGLAPLEGPSPHDDDGVSGETRDDGWRRGNVRGACMHAHIHTRSDTGGCGQPHLVHSTAGFNIEMGINILVGLN